MRQPERISREDERRYRFSGLEALRREIDKTFADVDAGKVRADYKNGLLLVTLPKSEKAKPKQIPVSVA